MAHLYNVQTGFVWKCNTTWFFQGFAYVPWFLLSYELSRLDAWCCCNVKVRQQSLKNTANIPM